MTSLNTNSYTWKITDPSMVQQIKSAEPQQTFISPKFSLCGFKWQFELSPNGQTKERAGKVSLFLNLIALSPKLESISLRKTCTFVECNYVHTATSTVTRDALYAGGWPLGKVKFDDLKKCNQFTFKVDVDINAVFDKDGKDVTDKYVESEESKTEAVTSSQDQQLNAAKLDSVIMQIEELSLNMKKMQKRMDDVELRMTEEQKDNNDDDRLDKIMKKMELMEQNMNKLSLNNNINPEEQKLKSWLELKVKLPEYYNVFIDNGIDDLSTASLLTMETIKGMGIDKIGHQMKILGQVSKLKQNKNDDAPNEGGTAYI